MSTFNERNSSWNWPMFVCIWTSGSDLLFTLKCAKVSWLQWNSNLALPTRCIYQVSNSYLKTCSINPGNSENEIFAKIGTYRDVCRGLPMYQLWRIYLDLWGHDCEKWVWLTSGCKVSQINVIAMKPKLDMSCHLLNVYTKYQIGISKHVEEKIPKTLMDGRTLPHLLRSLKI